MAGFIGLFDTPPWLHFTGHYYTTRVSTVPCSIPFLGSGFQQRTFPFLSVPELSPASATSFSQQQLTTTEPQRLSNSLSPLHSESKLCYDRRSVGQSVLVSSTHLEPKTRLLLLSNSYKRTGLSCTIAAGPRQRGYSRFQVPRDPWPYFTVSDSRSPQPEEPGPQQRLLYSCLFRGRCLATYLNAKILTLFLGGE
jgi:hypothetical protein